MPATSDYKCGKTPFKLLFSVLIWTCAFLVSGQPIIHPDSTTVPEAELEQISINQGLYQGQVNYLEKDQSGYLWVATQDGLNRQDGTGFKVFRHDSKDSGSIAGNFIQCLLVDSKNRLWVSVPPFGPDLFDPETETFIHFRHYPKDPNTINSGSLNKISEDPNGNILVMAVWKEFNCLSQKPGTKGKSVSEFAVRPFSELCPCSGLSCRILKATNGSVSPEKAPPGV